MRAALMRAALVVLLTCAAFGQTAPASGQTAPAPAFEVASVKPGLLAREGGKDGKRDGKRERIDHTPGSLTMRNVSMSSCIQWAYDVRSYQVSGPGWLESE